MRYNLIIGALLHDIGKLIYRSLQDGPVQEKRRHQELGLAWAREEGLGEEITAIIQRHRSLRSDDPEYDAFSVDAFRGEQGLHNDLYAVAAANDIAAGMERPAERAGGVFNPKMPLRSIFDRINLNPEKKYDGLNYWQMVPLSEFPYPREKVAATGAGYRKLWQSFRNGFKALGARPAEESLLALLQNYTFTIPEHTYLAAEPPDISLYHHLKTTAALTCCNYRYLTEEKSCGWDSRDLSPEIRNMNEEKYLLVAADLSGIQDFVYAPVSKGALKTLRARSFYLNLLQESIAARLLDRFALPRSCAIYIGGGGFFLLAPNTGQIRRGLADFRNELNSLLYAQFATAIFLALDFLPLNGYALSGESGYLKEARSAIRKKLDGQKNRKWENLLEEYDALFRPVNPPEYQCASCRAPLSGPKGVPAGMAHGLPVAAPEKMPEETPAGFGGFPEGSAENFPEGLLENSLENSPESFPEGLQCQFCQQMTRWSIDLNTIRALYQVEPAVPDERHLQCGGYYYCYRLKPADRIKRKYIMKNYWNAEEEEEEGEGKQGQGGKQGQEGEEQGRSGDRGQEGGQGQDVDRGEPDGYPVLNFFQGTFYTDPLFAGLVTRSLGIKRLGVLRMDVDYLGKVFSRGLNVPTLARLNDLSERLNLYFNYYLPALLQKEPQERFIPTAEKSLAVNLVYAGGDDLLLVGTWNAALETACQIQNDFTAFTAANSSLTLSGGLMIVDEKMAFYKSAEFAGEAEDKAKNEGRNRFCLFGMSFPWERLKNNSGNEISIHYLLSLFLNGVSWSKHRAKPEAFSRSFLQKLIFLAQQYRLKEDLWIFPGLYYLFARTMRKNNESFYKPILAAILQESIFKAELIPALQIVDYLTRGGGEGHE